MLLAAITLFAAAVLLFRSARILALRTLLLVADLAIATLRLLHAGWTLVYPSLRTNA